MEFLIRNPIVTFAAAVVLTALILGISSDAWLLRITEVMIWILFAASLNFLVSFGGMVSFGHAAYFGLGAYGFALSCRAGAPVLIAALIGPLIATFSAAVYGALCVRLTRIYFAMLTLACAEITY